MNNKLRRYRNKLPSDGGWATPWESVSQMRPCSEVNRGTKVKNITYCDKAFVTNFAYAFAQKTFVAVATFALRFRTKNICRPDASKKVLNCKGSTPRFVEVTPLFL